MIIEKKYNTVFITCFFNLAARNILGTDFFGFLSSKDDTRIVLLVAQGKKDFFKSEFKKDNIIIEEISFSKPSFMNLVFHYLSWNMLNTHSKKIHCLVELNKNGSKILYRFKRSLSFLGRIPFVVRIFRWLDYKIVKGGTYDELFKKYNPDVVFATDIQDLRVQESSDTYLIREARRHGIGSVGMPRSWDSITTKGLLRTLPDILVVQSQFIKNQVIKYHKVPEGKIKVVGTPHYDTYIKSKRAAREEFFINLGLNFKRKLILFCPPSDIWTGDKELTPFLLKLLSDLGEQVVVRFPLFGGYDVSSFEKPDFIVYDMPKNVSKLEESTLNLKEDKHLADLIYHSDVVITGPSSIILDASIFNKPAVFLGFDTTKRSLWQNLSRYYEYEHQKQVIKQGGFKIAKNPKELLILINHYLQFPGDGSEDRKAVAREVLDKFSLKGEGSLSRVLEGLFKKQ